MIDYSCKFKVKVLYEDIDNTKNAIAFAEMIVPDDLAFGIKYYNSYASKADRVIVASIAKGISFEDIDKSLRLKNVSKHLFEDLKKKVINYKNSVDSGREEHFPEYSVVDFNYYKTFNALTRAGIYKMKDLASMNKTALFDIGFDEDCWKDYIEFASIKGLKLVDETYTFNDAAKRINSELHKIISDHDIMTLSHNDYEMIYGYVCKIADILQAEADKNLKNTLEFLRNKS